ncbi:hypothetical protein V3C99_017248 [Haemonchus contortus]
MTPPNSGACPAPWGRGSARLTYALLHLPYAQPIPNLTRLLQVLLHVISNFRTNKQTNKQTDRQTDRALYI